MSSSFQFRTSSSNMSNALSSKLLQIYDTLPPEAQRSLFDKHLNVLLSSPPTKGKAKRVVSVATRLQKRYASVSSIDLKGKKKEIRLLLNEARRDVKRSLLKQPSNRIEILSEIIQSLATWVEEIWRIIYEHKVHFAQAHAALLYIWQTLLEISDGMSSGGCKCSILTLPLKLEIKTSSGKLVKRFSYPNIQSMDKVILWMWRELFVSMSAASGHHARKEISEMLVDIENNLGWKSLVKILFGGVKPTDIFDYRSDDEDEDEDENEDDDDDDDEESDDHSDQSDEESFFDSEEDDDEEEDNRCDCGLHAPHWSFKIDKHRVPVRRLVISHLQSNFQLEPSLSVFVVIVNLSEEPDKTSTELLDILSQIATNSSATFSAALAIYADQGKAKKIMELLDTHTHLLRPQDAFHYQSAVLTLTEEKQVEYRAKAFKIIEAQLLETVRSIRLLVHANFCNLDTLANKAELGRILKLRMASQTRIDRVRTWVDNVVSPSSGPGGPLHPMAFAAMMMGLPIPADDADDDTLGLGLLDVDPDDSDLQDLREELRPRLRERFLGWHQVASASNGGMPVLARVYNKIVDEKEMGMVWLEAKDIVDKMIEKLSDRSAKEHIAQALHELAEFVKVQRKKKVMRVKKRAAGTGTAKNPPTSIFSTPIPRVASLKPPASSSGSGSNSNSTSNSNVNPNHNTTTTPLFSFSLGSTFAPPPVYGGLDDVD